MLCPFCRQEFADERSLQKHLETCEAREQVSREMSSTIKIFDASGCFC